jgi:tetratricopeptide (TPR) repeat protein
MSAKDQAGELFNAGKYAEAIPLYKVIVESDPADLNAWQCLVMSLRNTQAYVAGVETAKAALKVHPRSAWLWRELGNMLIKHERLDEALRAFDQAKRIEPGSEWLWRYLSQLHKARKQPALEAEALEELVDLDKASAADLNRLGIIHHDNKNYSRALEFYRASAVMEDWTAPFFNMGLVYNDPEVSQDADAADAYRRALLIDATYQKASAELETTKAKLLPLAAQARSQAEGLVRKEDRYQHYLNPFDVLQLEPEDDYDSVDPKVIQRAKKKLLQELELNEGKVGWLDDQTVDKSRALTIDDELLDEAKRTYHLTVARNKRLSRFLTHGDVGHFLYADDYFPVDALALLDEDDGFRAFLSKPFAAQYNALLTRAIDKRAMAVVEVLFDGRRWVEVEDLDKCLAGAYKRAGQLVEIMKQLATESESRLVGLPEVQNALSVHDIPALLNLLPVQFRGHQTQVVGALRSMAINCHNAHQQTEMSRGILLLCKQFHFKSPELNEQLKKDYDKIAELIAHNEKYKDFLICFFCGKRPPNESTGIKKTIYGPSKRNWLAGTIEFSYTDVTLPRCEICNRVHAKRNEIKVLYGVGGLVVGLAIGALADGHFILGAIIGGIVGFVGGVIKAISFYKAEGIKDATDSTLAQHPLLAQRFKEGWSFTKPTA